jgi:hypothetical protein
MEIRFRNKMVAVRSLLEAGFSRPQIKDLMGYRNVRNVSVMYTHAKKHDVEITPISSEEITKLESVVGIRGMCGKSPHEVKIKC